MKSLGTKSRPKEREPRGLEEETNDTTRKEQNVTENRVFTAKNDQNGRISLSLKTNFANNFQRFCSSAPYWRTFGPCGVPHLKAQILCFLLSTIGEYFAG